MLSCEPRLELCLSTHRNQIETTRFPFSTRAPLFSKLFSIILVITYRFTLSTVYNKIAIKIEFLNLFDERDYLNVHFNFQFTLNTSHNFVEIILKTKDEMFHKRKKRTIKVPRFSTRHACL